ncbi:NAD(P)H:quinone oxidoreductase (plasmid) [Cupriavidus sp. P-10]|uniref:NAD(P)H:quinone oxidoreductase n=1 Tax=unclassified Cupriavidus TaxID=2640874 RepID=UPI0013146103|nr:MULTISPECIES: NAD(P)H:quinone oxidoreductase [unclassified Cupriavidus]BDB30699.1 NAD(P)H:quinone oxidoreductase [Cupriavidus sp. P-10]
MNESLTQAAVGGVEHRSAIRVLVIFHSWSGNTLSLAQAVAEGARSESCATVSIRRVSEIRNEQELMLDRRFGQQFAAACAYPVVTVDEVLDADVIILGCPTRMGTLSAEMKRFIDGLGPIWSDGALANKVGAAFTTASTPHGGQEMTLLSLVVAMSHLGMIVACPGYTADIFEVAGSPYGASSTSKVDGIRTRPRPADLAAAAALGNRSACVGAWVRRGRQRGKTLTEGERQDVDTRSNAGERV